MAARIVYTLAQAAQILEMPEPQVLGFIESNQLTAEFNQGLMSFMIQQDQLLEFMKSRKMFAQMQKIMMSRVLVCDRDTQLQFLLRTELERGGKVAVKIATTSKEVEIAVSEHLPDLLVMHVAAVQRATDNLEAVLRHARESRPIRLILYHNEPEIIADTREDLQRLRAQLNVDALVSIAAGTRKLLATIEELLGIRRNSTRTLPPSTGMKPPQPPRA
ncbi:MAG: hypothetical protein HYY16_02710 [Planctomycetes bacterium]|nr:hypothetical protein [Planctomycetota bacterium]